MATFRTLSMCKQLSTTWCKRKYAFVCSYATRLGSENKRIINAKKRTVKRAEPVVKAKSPKTRDIHSMIKPAYVVSNYSESEEHAGVDTVGELDKGAVKKILSEFYFKDEIRKLGKENDINRDIFRMTHQSFSVMCVEQRLSPDLHILLHDLTNGSGDITLLFPHFLRHSRQVFPHLEYMNELEKITDLTSPAQWYVEARKKTRKIIVHVGPTNSGKTYHAMQQFLQAESATYCCPLRLLAVEVCRSSNDQGVPCDMKTGELITFASDDNSPGNHVACTVEMASMEDCYDVAVIDEIQMMRDMDRGWAWTRAFLGLQADEIHVCGEQAAVPLIENLAVLTGDTVEIKTYERLLPLKYLDKPVETLNDVQPGDCIVCFSIKATFTLSAALNELGIQTAIIYGSLPPATKIAQAKKFNDPLDPCKVLVATDAIGMGVNLNIRRIIFFTLDKTFSEKGRTVTRTIGTSTALQIAGRAGRYGTDYLNGEVTTFRKSELSTLHRIVQQEVKPIQSAGLKPTPEQIELFSYQLPEASLKELLNMFEVMAKHDEENFFMCELDQMKEQADMIEDIGLSMKDQFSYACAPIDIDNALQCDVFVEFARKHCNEEPISLVWLTNLLGWPLKIPKTVTALKNMESIFNCLDIYLWFSKYYPDIYQDEERVREIQKELEIWIEDGLVACVLKKLTEAQRKRVTATKVTGEQPATNGKETGSADVTDKQELKQQATKETKLAGITDGQKLDKPAAKASIVQPTSRVQAAKASRVRLTSTKAELADQSEAISGMITFLKKGGISEKRLKRLSKKLNLDPNFGAPRSIIGKHPRKVSAEKKLTIRNLGNILKNRKKR